MTDLPYHPLFTAKNFIAWVRQQPSDKTYDYSCNYTCPGAAFLTEVMPLEGSQYVSVGPSDWSIRTKDAPFSQQKYRFPHLLDGILCFGSRDEWTYGKLLKRLERVENHPPFLADFSPQGA